MMKNMKRVPAPRMSKPRLKGLRKFHHVEVKKNTWRESVYVKV
jgi:hypothetical protein